AVAAGELADRQALDVMEPHDIVMRVGALPRAGLRPVLEVPWRIGNDHVHRQGTKLSERPAHLRPLRRRIRRPYSAMVASSCSAATLTTATSMSTRPASRCAWAHSTARFAPVTSERSFGHATPASRASHALRASMAFEASFVS